MKKPILPILTALAALAPLAFAPLRAQDDSGKDKEQKKESAEEGKDKPQADEKKPGKEEKKPEEDAKPEEDSDESDKQTEKEDLAKVKKMLAVFQTLEGEWTGSEKIVYNQELPPLKNKKPKSWKDEWKGFFTQAGRFFEMTGKSEGDLSSTYHWYVTYDTSKDEYRAWNFGSSGFTEYTGELSRDKKAVVWKKLSEGEETDVEDTFELRADGNRCTAKGDTRILSKDGRQSVSYAEQTSSYTRKKIEI